MKDILRPILELLVVLPGLLLGYFPVKTYLKQSPGRLAAWLFPLMACLCIGSGLACYRLHASTVFALAGVALAAICLYTGTLTISLWKSGTIALAVCAVFACVNSLSRAVSAAIIRNLQLPPDGPWLCLGACVFYNAVCWVIVLAAYYPATHTVRAMVEDDNFAQTWYVFCGADIVEINTIRKRLSAVKGGRFALACAPAAVYSVVLSDILGDPLDMIASGPACPDSSTCAQAAAIAEKYRLALSPAAAALLRQETPKTLPNVTTKITGSVRELCRAAADACRAEGYEPVLLTDCLCCEAREAGSLLGSIARTHAGQGRRQAFIAGGETVVHLTGHGLGGRNQELALAAAPALAGLRGCCVFSVGSDGTDGPTDAAGGYTDGEALAALTAAGLDVPRALADNDAYHALQAVGGLIMTGPTGTNVNDVAVVLTE